MKKKWLGLIGILILLIIGGAWYAYHRHVIAQENQSIRTVRIAYLPITHALPLFAAKELERPNGPVHIELVKYSSWPELMDALNTGKVDGASVLIELAVKAREQGIDVRAAALGHTAGNMIIVGNDINTVQDLRGKRIAIPHKQSTQKLMLDQMLEEAGMSEKDVIVTEMAPTEMPSALAVNQIAGYIVAEPFGAKSTVLHKGKVLMDPEKTLWPDSVCCALVFNGTFVDKHPELARQVTKEYLAAGQYLTDHPDQQLPIAKKYMKVNDAILAQSLKWIRFDHLQITAQQYDELTKRMVKEHLLKWVPAYKDFVDQSLSH